MTEETVNNADTVIADTSYVKYEGEPIQVGPEAPLEGGVDCHRGPKGEPAPSDDDELMDKVSDRMWRNMRAQEDAEFLNELLAEQGLEGTVTAQQVSSMNADAIRKAQKARKNRKRKKR